MTVYCAMRLDHSNAFWPRLALILFSTSLNVIATVMLWLTVAIYV